MDSIIIIIITTSSPIAVQSYPARNPQRISSTDSTFSLDNLNLCQWWCGQHRKSHAALIVQSWQPILYFCLYSLNRSDPKSTQRCTEREGQLRKVRGNLMTHDPTQPTKNKNSRPLPVYQPNPTHGSTTPMDNSEALWLDIETFCRTCLIAHIYPKSAYFALV